MPTSIKKNETNQVHLIAEWTYTTMRSDLMLYAVWNRFTWRINGSLTLKGHSRAAEKTCFVVPELGLFLDGALQCHLPPRVMCITHCHSDHSTAIPMILTGITTVPNIYVPRESFGLFDNYLQCHYQLAKGSAHAESKRYKLHGKLPGDVWRETIKGREYEFRAIKCYHSVPTIGYGLSAVKNKMRADLVPKIASMKPHEIGRMRREIEEIGGSMTEECLEPILTFLCDTTPQVFEDPAIFTYPTIIVECTNLYDEHEHYAVANKHICWTQIRDIVIEHPDNLFVLIHFSMRYSWEEIDEFFEKETQEHGISNIYIWRN